MGIEVRLKGFLQEHDEDKHGILNKIVAGTHRRVSRQTISRLYNGSHDDCSLRTLSALCDSLAHTLDLDPDSVLKDLLGMSPANLWVAVAKSECVRICLGERRDLESSGFVSAWLSRRDAAVCTHIVSSLSRATPPPKITVCYAPSSLYSTPSAIGKDSTTAAARLFKTLRTDRSNTSTILIGSQRANDLVEMFVADLFNCEPFKADRARCAVPFYLTFRKGISRESCFGGPQPVPGSKGLHGPGIAYVDETDQWHQCPWGRDGEDSGVVIVVRDATSNSLEIACLGLSGWATEALGRAFLADGDAYCRNTVGTAGGLVSVCVCRFHTDRSTENGERLRATNIRRVFLSHRVLRQYISQNASRHLANRTGDQ